MDLATYVLTFTERGACMCGRCADAPENPEQKQPTGHTADLIFFKVRAAARQVESLVAPSQTHLPSKEMFLEKVRAEFPQWLDGRSRTYMETGADMGDQGLALMTMGLGSLLGAFELQTPRDMVPGIDDARATQMAGMGYLGFKAKP